MAKKTVSRNPHCNSRIIALPDAIHLRPEGRQGQGDGQTAESAAGAGRKGQEDNHRRVKTGRGIPVAYLAGF